MTQTDGKYYQMIIRITVNDRKENRLMLLQRQTKPLRQDKLLFEMNYKQIHRETNG